MTINGPYDGCRTPSNKVCERYLAELQADPQQKQLTENEISLIRQGWLACNTWWLTHIMADTLEEKEKTP